jgi:ABC-2 type transport system permease protein
MRKQVAFVLAYLELNLSAAMEYRVAFISQTAGMVLNDAMMLVFWWMFFERFPLVGGWQLLDVLRLWAVVAVSFGLGTAVFGNCMRLAPMIARGQLDYYLTLPKDALLHTLVSRMSTSAWGDVLFGIVAFLAAGSLTPLRISLFVLLALTGCAIFVAFHVIVGSIAFWFGNAETLASQASAAITNFATYPGSIFQGWVKVLTFTLLPAALLGHVPVDQLRNPSPLPILGVAAFAAFIVLLAVAVFRLGLRQYQSGNLVQLQG